MLAQTVNFYTGHRVKGTFGVGPVLDARAKPQKSVIGSFWWTKISIHEQSIKSRINECMKQKRDSFQFTCDCTIDDDGS